MTTETETHHMTEAEQKIMENALFASVDKANETHLRELLAKQ